MLKQIRVQRQSILFGYLISNNQEGFLKTTTFVIFQIELQNYPLKPLCRFGSGYGFVIYLADITQL